MTKTIIPENYKSKLTLYRTQTAIGRFKRIFEGIFCENLNLKRVSAPLFVESGSGLNDDLTGEERPVGFVTKEGKSVEIVHSLAKWKRLALYRYDFIKGNGIYTDMNAIRRDEDTDNLHSVYVDQWDWEKVIGKSDRNIEFLKNTVRLIIRSIHLADLKLKKLFPEIEYTFKDEVTFISAQELLDLYPDKSPDERERLFVKEHGTSFIIGIGGKLTNGLPHGDRAPDYDDWQLNGDIVAYNEILDCAFELSSMGIRVDAPTLLKQLQESGKTERKDRYFHRMLLSGKLPLTIGGGIGQSRLSMLLLEKAHIGEVQVSCWDSGTVKTCEEAGILLL